MNNPNKGEVMWNRFITWTVCDLLERHDFFAIRTLSEQSQQIGCRRCRRLYAINHSVRAVLPWDSELEEFYKKFGLTPTPED